jgi:hypothetical protein
MLRRMWVANKIWIKICSMDISSDGKLNIQHDVMTGGNLEGLIDVSNPFIPSYSFPFERNACNYVSGWH